ncbi:MAG TPA: DUF4242 domain-containing protein [Gammaproteobacteria bacterium]|nr:DUF4242 domain-containing protein [Gammaproteobacteria bacterium]
MPRYVVEHDLDSALDTAGGEDGTETQSTAAPSNTNCGVVWMNSYISPDNRKTLCIYDAPTPDAIRRFADKNNLPVSQIMEVTVLDLHYYQ